MVYLLDHDTVIILILCSSGTGVQEMAESSSSKIPPSKDQTPHSSVPVVPFDMDLYYWDNSEGKPPPIKKVW